MNDDYYRQLTLGYYIAFAGLLGMIILLLIGIAIGYPVMGVAFASVFYLYVFWLISAWMDDGPLRRVYTRVFGEMSHPPTNELKEPTQAGDVE